MFSWTKMTAKKTVVYKVTIPCKGRQKEWYEPCRSRDDGSWSAHFPPYLPLLAYSNKVLPKNKICLKGNFFKPEVFDYKKLHPANEPGVWCKLQNNNWNVCDFLKIAHIVKKNQMHWLKQYDKNLCMVANFHIRPVYFEWIVV